MAVDKKLLREVIDVLSQSFEADGGELELIDVSDDGVVTVELGGSCSNCVMRDKDISEGVERILMEHVPGVTAVRGVSFDMF